MRSNVRKISRLAVDLLSSSTRAYLSSFALTNITSGSTALKIIPAF
jgi:hypothetical protein